MARCPYLGWEERGLFASQCDYYCEICKKYLSDSEVKYKCKVDYGENYKDCPIYKNR